MQHVFVNNPDMAIHTAGMIELAHAVRTVSLRFFATLDTLVQAKAGLGTVYLTTATTRPGGSWSQ